MVATLSLEDSTKLKFDKLQMDLRTKDGIRRNQDELLNLLINFYKEAKK